MPKQPPTYDLVLLLSTSAEDDRRAKILGDVESAISEGGGSIEHKDGWGTRAMTYRINHQADADYHLLQFTGPPTLLEALSHNLRITDGVLRFRIIKAVAGGSPPSAARPARSAATDAKESTGDAADEAASASAADPGTGR